MKPHGTLRLVLALCFLSVAGHARAQKLAVSGCVVDAAGNPVADVEVASSWSAEGGAMKAHQSVVTDAQGRFSLKLNDFGQPLGILALDAKMSFDFKEATLNEVADFLEQTT